MEKSFCLQARQMLRNRGPLIVFLLVISFSTPADASGEQQHQMLGSSWMAVKQAVCRRGSMAECMAEGEFKMDSEINRRILATTNYISYGALQRDTVPCSRRGASYYNCRPGAEANPYSRGCSAITRCRG